MCEMGGKGMRIFASIPQLRGRLLRLVCRLEGGPMWSCSYRHLLKRYYGLEVGMHSYGDPIWPGGLPEGTRIGNYCSLAAGIAVFRRNHPINRMSQHPFFYNAATGMLNGDTIQAVRDNPLVIEDDVWIGANVIITPGCRIIGLGAVVAAGSVVTKDVPPFAVVGGNPARRIRDRFPEDIQQVLRESRWWEHSIEDLKLVLSLFLKDATIEGARALLAHVRTLDRPRQRRV